MISKCLVRIIHFKLSEMHFICNYPSPDPFPVIYGQNGFVNLAGKG
jgi:hypothetical protein